MKDRVMAAVFWLSAAVVLSAFCWIMADIFLAGWQAVDWDFFTGMPARAGREGGIAPVLVSTFWLLAVALGVSVPLGAACAVFLAEFTRRGDPFGRAVRRSLDILAGVPSIVFGLFGMAFFCQFLGWGWTLLSGGLTLGCMALPLVIRTTEEGLRAVPASYRQGCEALGISKAAALKHILLPAASPGLMAGLALGLGRALAETAAVMYTAGASLRMPSSLMDSGRSLAYHIYILSIEVPGGTDRAYAAALVLVGLLLAVNLVSYSLVRGFLKGRALA
jgi:phosphate transport system permease protein